MAIDHNDDQQRTNKLVRRVKGLELGAPLRHSPDQAHAGEGPDSLQLGPGAAAMWIRCVALGAEASAYDEDCIAVLGSAISARGISIGRLAYSGDEGDISVGYNARAQGGRSVSIGEDSVTGGVDAVALGPGAVADEDRSVAIGAGVNVVDADQIVIGKATHAVEVPGTFSNPSARCLKQNIEDAPELESIFPKLYEWEYIDGDGRRRIGPIADELVGTDAERFVTFRGTGEVAGIAYVEMHTAQIGALHAGLMDALAEIRDLRAVVEALKKKLGD